MKGSSLPEVWLRGPLPGIPPLLQPVAHALLQAREEVMELMEDFPDENLWDRPAGMASPGFHLQHLTGVLDRLLTYAGDEMLDKDQLEALSGEGTAGMNDSHTRDLLHNFSRQIDRAISQIAATPENTLTDPRGVGRAKIPSTVIGLLVHAAEHTQRHNGQLLVTVKCILSQATP